MNSLVLSLILKILGITIPLLLGVAFLTLAERKVMASMQRRKGPNVAYALKYERVGEVKIPLPSYLFLRTSEQKGTKENKGRVL
jgi:hypothetical protein